MTRTGLTAAAFASVLTACASVATPAGVMSGLDTGIVSMTDVATDVQDWGSFTPHYLGQTASLQNVLTGVADLRPGYTNHPPHRHAEEEFLMVISGEGTWTLDGQTTPARAGDILFARPWDFHGLANTGDETLRFVVFKYNAKGLPVPVDPDPARGEYGTLDKSLGGASRP